MTGTQPMSSADAAWLHMDQPTNLMVITGVLWFDETPDWDAVREIIRERFVEPYPRFSQLAVEGRTPLSGPHWQEDPDFDLDLHLHRVALPSPGDQQALRDLVGDITATPLDPARPLWQFHLVDGYGEGAAMISRIHHCIADGIALSRVMLSLTDDLGDDGGGRPAKPDRQRSKGLLGSLAGQVTGAVSAATGLAGTVAHESLEVARHPSHLGEIAGTGRDDADALAHVLLRGAETPTPLKGEMGVAKSVTWSEPIPLEDLREMGHQTGTTINDIVLTAMAGSFRKYLQSRDGLVDEVTAVIPFNLREPGKPLPTTLGNLFGLVFLGLPVNTGNRRTRLQEIHERMDRIKHSPEGAISYGLLGALGKTAPQVEKRLIDVFSSRGTAVITNVPGPREKVFLAGTPVAGVLVWAPSSGDIPMTVSIFSYAGEVTVGLMVDTGLIPDPDEIVRGFETELRALLRLKRL